MAKRSVVLPKAAPLADNQGAIEQAKQSQRAETDDKKEVKTKVEATTEILVRGIPVSEEAEFLKLKMEWKKRGIKKLPNGERVSLSGLMKYAFSEMLKEEVKKVTGA